MNDKLSQADASQAIQRLESESPPQGPMDLLRLAVERGNVDVGTLERLMVVRKEVLAETARTAFFDALAAFQAECPIILRNRAGHENRYNYAPLETIVAKVTPFLTRHGFSHQEDGVVTDGWVEAIVTVTHRGGHREEKRFKVPSVSNAGMSPQQKYGAAMTYATRYAFCAAFGIRTADSDTDCSPETDAAAREKAKTALWNFLLPVSNGDTTWKTARQWLIDECNFPPDKKVLALDTAGYVEWLTKAKKRMAEIEEMRKGAA